MSLLDPKGHSLSVFNRLISFNVCCWLLFLCVMGWWCSVLVVVAMGWFFMNNCISG